MSREFYGKIKIFELCLKKDESIVFIHISGIRALFVYKEQLLALMRD